VNEKPGSPQPESSQQESPPPAGIVISGGSVKIGAMAQGPHARASYKVVRSSEDQLSGDQLSGEQRENLADLMRSLLEALRVRGGDLPDHETVQAAADEVSAELDQENPDKSRIRRLLTTAAAAAGSVTEIAAAVAAIQHAIGGL
jgi:hypothetical protein